MQLYIGIFVLRKHTAILSHMQCAIMFVILKNVKNV